MLEDNIRIIKNTFAEYQGTGMFVALFFLSILYIFLYEKDKKMRTLFINFPLLILIVTLNPLFNKVIGKMFKETTYWRVYWMIPLSLEIAYGTILFIKNQSEKKNKIITTIALILIIILSGKYTYTTQNFIKVGNLYKLPDESVRVAQLIGADETEYKKAIVPDSMIAHIRQIDSSIKLAYKRDPTGVYENNLMRLALNSGDVESLTSYTIASKVNYIVFSKATVLTKPMEDFGYEKVNETENYAIYRKK